jgi:hypothetical protein
MTDVDVAATRLTLAVALAEHANCEVLAQDVRLVLYAIDARDKEIERLRSALILAEDLYQRGALNVSREEWNAVHDARLGALASGERK